MKKRILSLLLALVLAVSLLPVSAVAETDAGLDLSKFTFTLSSDGVTDERYQYNAVTVAKKADGTYSLTAPTYAVTDYGAARKTYLTIKAPADLGKEFTVTNVKKAEKKRTAAPPFTTSTLQQEASRRLNMTPKRTMAIAQQLYEGVDVEGEGTLGLITYMRTDSVRLSDEAMAAAAQFISTRYGKDYYYGSFHV